MTRRIIKLRRLATCKRKKKYTSKQDAEEARLGLRMECGIEDTLRLESYRCRICERWHIGNGNKKRRTLPKP